MTLFKKRILPLILSIAIVIAFTPAMAMSAFAVPDYYNINISPSTNGVVKTIDDGKVITGQNEGKTVKVTAIAFGGYTCKNISITETGTGKQVKLSQDSTFVMPLSDVTISATFEKMPNTLKVSPAVLNAVKSSGFLGFDFNGLVITEDVIEASIEKWINNSEKETSYFDVESILVGFIQFISALPENATLSQIADRLVLAIDSGNMATMMQAFATEYGNIFTEASWLVVGETISAAEAAKCNLPIVEVIIVYNYFMGLFADKDMLYDLAEQYVEENKIKDSTAADIVMCVLNSDVILKGKAKLLEACQTKNIMTITTTLMALYPKVEDEVNKCLGGKDAIGPLSVLFKKAITLQCELFTDADKAVANNTITATATKKGGYVQLKWESKLGDLAGYEIYSLNEEGKYEYEKTVDKCSAKLDTLAESYKIRAVLKYEGKKLYSKYVKVKPILATPKIKSVKETAKYITITWNSVPGAVDYIVCYSILGKKNYKYIPAGKTSVKIKKVKKAKTYKVKVKAFYDVGSICAKSDYSKLAIYKIA